MATTRYRARWVLPITRPPIENGQLEVVDGRIAAMGRSTGSKTGDIDLGDVAILPGLVNAHTHSELTVCHRRVPYAGSFTDWLQGVMDCTPQRAGNDLLERSVGEGLARSLTAGTTVVGDIGSGPRVCALWPQAPLHVVGFLEVMGMGTLHRQRVAADRSVMAAVHLIDEAEASRCATSQPTSLLWLGLTPHAPYSTDQIVYTKAIEFIRLTGRPICTHLAETRDEAPFLLSGTGPFREMLERFGLWDGTFEPPGCSPVHYAQRLGLLDLAPLLAHVNYVSDEDLALLATSNASVAFCPRTHRFFEHDPHPYEDMLARGINVCVGTDSLASNETLSVLDEMRFLRSIDRVLSDAQILRMGTLAGAVALGIAGEVGSLETGKRADFITVPLAHRGTSEPSADVLGGRENVSAVFLAGRHSWKPTS
ncbi:MAG: cytosine deaminase [Phycisphaerae bacterium]